jgi:hypothetical protein
MITYENANNVSELQTEWPDALNAMSAGANLSWALDPNFAAAHTEIAWVYWSRANGSDNPNELMPKVKAATDNGSGQKPTAN